ncbi:MAG TPA: DUF255 domain-containing protein [Terrimesophilobacter sp.]|uniref:thioredoxin domain-containing protein n=1 Tax=Terrimesophilobacter sp. TaxID=2906435 RepID=UPI002F92B535
MPNSLAGAISPYLRSHAGNPVAWQQWGAEPFAEAVRRDVPVFVSIGYSTCHWCHVMARESFSDLAIAEYLNAHFVAIKVDREEHPEVDSGYLAAASAFTRNLGWPLNVFVTPAGRAFFAGTYWPPDAMAGHPSFRQVLEGVANAWTERRSEVEASSAAVAEAIVAQGERPGGELPDRGALAAVVDLLARNEDAEFGGFGTAPKFPVVPVLNFLLEQPGATGPALGDRTLTAIAGSGLRDPVEGGFFRYATRRDWTEPHYERMLYDNAQLLRAYALLALRVPERAKLAAEVSAGIADYLLTVLRLPGGVFASAQNSESMVDGYLTEGDYYSLSAEERAKQEAPALDDKVLTGWNGLAIGALAFAGFHLDRADWVAAARTAADSILTTQMKADGDLLRATVGGVPSAARATLEDYGLLASGLLHLGQATGEVRWAIEARRLVDACLRGSAGDPAGSGFAVPGGGDPVLAQQGLLLAADPSEGAYPSGLSAMGAAAHRLHLLTGDRSYRAASERAIEQLVPLALQQPLGFGAALAEMAGLAEPAGQLVVVSDDSSDPLTEFARGWFRSGGLCVVVTSAQAVEWAESGFELFEARVAKGGVPTAYLCQDFVCRLPVTDVAGLRAADSDQRGGA